MSPPLWRVARYFLMLGATGFGGPVALTTYMRRDLIEREKWFSPEEFDEGLAIATACPGPLAYQLGIYCGYLTHGITGALAVAFAFAAAPFVFVSAAAYLYVRYGSAWELRALFLGIAPVVVALIFKSCVDLGRKTLRRDAMAWAFAGAACAFTVLVQKELFAVLLAAGVIGIFVFATKPVRTAAAADGSPSRVTLGAIALPVLPHVALSKIFWFFFKTGFLVFGSGLVIVPFLKAYVVDQYHWLSTQAFVDSIAIGIVSPGPVVITATFVGYVVGAFPGALVATAGMFAPSLAFVIAGTPILRRYRSHPRVQGFVRGITVAVVGVLIGTSFLLARTMIHGIASAVILLVALAILVLARKVPDQALVAGGAAAGLITYSIM
ncbi:MAG TPA: chromate efflux transporter [Candidatus Baltobacteraceae bacterium]|nr:chromate efflux transporter [Candidatus Baltobacteraceae bacterium]